MPQRLRDPAVVLNCETGGVGILHSLGRAGVDVLTFERRRSPLLGRFSRYSKQHVGYTDDRLGALADALLQAADRFDGKGVLFPSTDADLEEIIAAQEKLSARYHVPAAAAIGNLISEKNWQYELAERTGVPIPRCTRFPAGRQPDIQGFRFPLIVKPSSRAPGAGKTVFRLQVVQDQAGLDACLRQIAAEHAGREFQVAENIPGEPDQLYTVGCYGNREGRLLRAYTGRKISQYPFTHGMASIAESIPVEPTLVAHARALLEGCGFHGIAQVEFKYDARDGLYKLLEINGRSWSWVRLPTACGVNLPLIQYYDLVGDERLTKLLAAPQDEGSFYVHDFYIRLNQLAFEQQQIDRLGRDKQVVRAILSDDDRRLNLAYRLISAAKLIRRRRIQ